MKGAKRLIHKNLFEVGQPSSKLINHFNMFSSSTFPCVQPSKFFIIPKPTISKKIIRKFSLLENGFEI